MKRPLCLLLCLLLLTGCSQQSQSPQDADEMSLEEISETQDITLTIGRKLPLPVTEDRIQAYYQSSDGFYRYVLDVWEEPLGFLVWSVSMPYTDTGEAPHEKTRFDWIYKESGYCYAILEGWYAMDFAITVEQGGVALDLIDDWTGPITVSAHLDHSLVDINTGKPLRQAGLYCTPEAYSSPQEFSLEDGPLLTLPGSSDASSLEAAYFGADSLELMFDTSEHAAFPQVEISYDQSLGELTLMCLRTDLRRIVSGGNLYVENIRAEQRGADAAVVCSLGTAAPEDTWMHSAHANAIQVETEYLPGYDCGKGVLRLTFWPFMG